MTLSGLEWLSKIFNDTKRRAVSLRQLSFLFAIVHGVYEQPDQLIEDIFEHQMSIFGKWEIPITRFTFVFARNEKNPIFAARCGA